jgi:DNA-directed RNA polymerase subunit A'
MNLHVVQSEEARAEARILMRVQEHILSPRFGGPVIGMIHDHITGMFFLTHKNPIYNRDQVISLMSRVKDIPLPEPDVDGEYWSGKAIFSILLPDDLNMVHKSSICEHCKKCKKDDCDIDAYVKISNGKLLCGTIDGNSVGAMKGKLLDTVTRDYGSDAGRQFIDFYSKICIGAIMLRGFTTGIDDEDIPEEAKRQINDTLTKAIKEVESLVQSYREGMLEQMPGRSLQETLEVGAMEKLGKARNKAGEIAGKHLGLENSAVVMAKSGARGSMLNLSQMAGSIGQQAVRGQRITRGYFNRTLPHFQKGDLGADSRGFVKSSYKSGLNPTEYFFHSMGGREGLVDTAVRTSRSGYMQRRLINALEDLRVMSDGTVRNTANTIIQLIYGDDKIDPARASRGKAVVVEDIVNDVLGVE